MKYLLCTLALIVAGGISMSAQKKVTVTVKSEVPYNKLLPADMLYEYDAYQKGKLYYKDGGAVSREYNFSLLSGACLFKDKPGQELEVAFPEQIALVVIDSSRWYPVDGSFGKSIYSSQQMDLIRIRRTKCLDIRKEGAFGGMSNTAAVTNITSFRGAGGSTQTLSVPGEYDFETRIEYYLKRGDTIEYADAKGFRKLFPRQKNEINNLIKSRKLNLDKESDIIELIKVLTFE